MSEEILWALNVLGKMSTSMFSRTLSDFCLIASDPGNQEIDFRAIISKAIRLMDAVGLVELDSKAGQVFACPPAIVITPAISPFIGVLVGTRTPGLVRRIQAFVARNKDQIGILTEPQEVWTSKEGGGFLNALRLPPSMMLEASDPSLFMGVGEETGIFVDSQTPAAWALANYSVGVNEYFGSLQKGDIRELNWQRRWFDNASLVFSRADHAGKQSLLVEYTHAVTRDRIYYYWEDGSATEVDKNWGRYLSLSRNRRKVLVYDPRTHCLMVPATVPMPPLIARAMAMCSGKIPCPGYACPAGAADLPPGHPVDMYRGVPPEYASILARKLGQELTLSRVDKCMNTGGEHG